MLPAFPRARSKLQISRNLSLVLVAAIACITFLTIATQVLRPSTPDLASSNPTHLRVPIPEATQQCRFFLAESAIPMGGLGVYAAIDIEEGQEAQPMPDICVYVADTPKRTQFETHSWARDVFFGSWEGKNPRGACEGFATLFNSMPSDHATSKLKAFPIHTNGGLDRRTQPGAGAISHYYGVSSTTLRQVPAGSEMTIDYGDWEYDEDKTYRSPIRTTDWLQRHGLCIDHIRIRPATDPKMGRGAFASRALPRGTMVAPAPLQTYLKRDVFAEQDPEALFVNYCFQPANMTLLLFPYGPGVNMINHSPTAPNVALRWSTSSLSRTSWLNLDYGQFWQMYYPGGLILEVIALRDIEEGEELFLDYGPAWEAAWQEHVQTWKPYQGDYIYPADMDLSQPIRTVKEQESQPYPHNLATVCWVSNWERDYETRLEWKQPEWDWPEGVVPCKILNRTTTVVDGKESYLYEVSIRFTLTKIPDYDPFEDPRFVDYNVPQEAISFVDRPYESDMHLKNAFRHPIGLPEELVPKQWQAHPQS